MKASCIAIAIVESFPALRKFSERCVIKAFHLKKFITTKISKVTKGLNNFLLTSCSSYPSWWNLHFVRALPLYL